MIASGHEAAVDPQRQAQPEARAFAAAPANAMRMLIAEDNIVNQKVAVEPVQKLGCHADVVEQRPGSARRAGSGELRSGADGLPDAGAGRLRSDGGNPLGKEGTRHTIIAMTAHAIEGDRESAWRPAWTII